MVLGTKQQNVAWNVGMSLEGFHGSSPPKPTYFGIPEYWSRVGQNTSECPQMATNAWYKLVKTRKLVQNHIQISLQHVYDVSTSNLILSATTHI